MTPRLPVLVLVLAILPLSAAQSPTRVPSTPKAGSWGEPVNGVQVRLSVSPDAPAAGDLPHLELEIYNMRTEVLSIPRLWITGRAFTDFEIDGTWYGPGGGGGSAPGNGPITVRRGAQSEKLPLQFPKRLYRLDAVTGAPNRSTTLSLTPGNHSVRARVQIDLDDKRMISNVVTIQVR